MGAGQFGILANRPGKRHSIAAYVRSWTGAAFGPLRCSAVENLGVIFAIAHGA